MNNIESVVIPISGIRAWLFAITPAVKFQSWQPVCLPVHCQTYILPFVHSFQSCLPIASLPSALPSCHMRYFLGIPNPNSWYLDDWYWYLDAAILWRFKHCIQRLTRDCDFMKRLRFYEEFCCVCSLPCYTLRYRAILLTLILSRWSFVLRPSFVFIIW